jgi:PAS domain S-box-containing protein
MTFQITTNLLPLIACAILSFLLVVHLLWRKKTRQFPVLVILMAASLTWLLGSVGEVIADGYGDKLLWLKLRQTGLLWIPLLWLVFIYQFSGKKKWIKPLQIGLLSILPGMASLLVWTNEYHFLFWKTVEIELPDIILAITPGSVNWIKLVYGTLLILACIPPLLGQITKENRRKTAQAVILLFCTLAPLAARGIDILTTSGVQKETITTYVFAISALIFMVGLYYFQLLDVVTAPAQNIFAGMQDGILVLNSENRVLHANPAAEAIFGQPVHELYNQQIETVFASVLSLQEKPIIFSGEITEEIQLNTSEGNRYFELRLSDLRERGNHTSGKLAILRNISPRIEAQNTSRQSQFLLKQSEEKFRSLVENIDEIIFSININGLITYISPAIEQIAGYRAEELIGKSFRTLVYPDDLPILETRSPTNLDAQKANLEFRILSRNKNIRQIRAYSYPIRQNGKITGLQGVLTDITERKQVEEALERRAAQLAILNFIGERIAAVFELDGLFESAVQLIQSNFGYYHVAIFTPDVRWNMMVMRANSGSFSHLFPENHRLMLGQGMVGWVAEHKTTLLSNDIRLEPRYTNLYPDKIPTCAELVVPLVISGELMGVLDIQSPLINAFDDNDVRVMETVADQIAVAMEKARLYEEVRLQLKERERKETTLRIQRDLLEGLSPAKSLQETLQVAAEIFATELKANQVAISLVDWDQQNIRTITNVGFPIHPGTPPSTANNNIAGWVARSGRAELIKNVKTDARKPETFPGTLSLLCFPLISHEKVIGVINLESSLVNFFTKEDEKLLDTLANSLVMLIERARLFEEVVTARAELEKRAEELEEANASLREMDRLKTQFLANMSHELRTPLNSIIGFSEVLVDELVGPINEEQKEYGQDILDSGKHLLSLINDLLDFSKMNAGHISLNPIDFSVDALFDELRVSLLPLVQKKQQSLVFHLGDPHLQITADRLRIKQVFMNLISNANKFTPEGGSITVSCHTAEPDEILFSIQDTGVGIRVEDQQIIFEEFRQVDGSMTREVPGTGLGLAISRRIVEIHNGSIWVESELGKGSTFYVCFPANYQTILPL